MVNSLMFSYLLCPNGDHWIQIWFYINLIWMSIWFQSPYNEISYSVIGNDQALPFFYIQPDTGVVSLKSSIAGSSISPFTVSTVVFSLGFFSMVEHDAFPFQHHAALTMLSFFLGKEFRNINRLSHILKLTPLYVFFSFLKFMQNIVSQGLTWILLIPLYFFSLKT